MGPEHCPGAGSSQMEVPVVLRAALLSCGQQWAQATCRAGSGGAAHCWLPLRVNLLPQHSVAHVGELRTA